MFVCLAVVVVLFSVLSEFGGRQEAAAAVADLKHLNQSYESHDYARAHTHTRACARTHARNTDTTSTELSCSEPSGLCIANKR